MATVVATLVAVGMEPWSRIVHDRLWHGALYRIHRTHHPAPGAPPTWLEANDVFSIVHAPPAMLALYLGLRGEGLPAAMATGFGLGMSVYGVAYVLVHDGLVHGRLPMGFLRRWRYFRRIRAAHEIHHRHGGVPFGLFLGPRELRRARARAYGEVPSGTETGSAASSVTRSSSSSLSVLGGRAPRTETSSANSGRAS